MARLGIVDWGIGGVSILKLINERIGDVPIIYFSDTGVTPYGKMTRPELVARLNTVIADLKAQGVTHLVIGCNAASTAIGQIDPQGLRVVGMIDSGVAAVMKEKPKRLGLIGGRRTVLSGVYGKAFAERGLAIKQRIAQPLSALIESGDTGSQKLRRECKRILAPLKNCSHILIACTHYPAITSVMKEYVSAETEFIDPAGELVNKIERWKLAVGKDKAFLTTGDPANMKRAAMNAFGYKIDIPYRCKL